MSGPIVSLQGSCWEPGLLLRRQIFQWSFPARKGGRSYYFQGKTGKKKKYEVQLPLRIGKRKDRMADW